MTRNEMIIENLEMMNEDGQIAILTNGDHDYYYYIFKELVIRVDDELRSLHANPEFEYDILTEDLQKMDIIYLSDRMVHLYLTEDDFDDCFDSSTKTKICKYFFDRK